MAEKSTSKPHLSSTCSAESGYSGSSDETIAESTESRKPKRSTSIEISSEDMSSDELDPCGCDSQAQENKVKPVVKSSCRRNWVLSFRVLMAVGLCGLLYVIVETSGLTSSKTPEPEKPTTSKIPYRKRGLASPLVIATDPETHTIKSYNDLVNIPNLPKTIEVLELTSPFDLEGKKPKRTSQTHNVKEIKVTGSITEQWLKYLLEFFPKIQKVNLNIDGLCQGSNERDREGLEALRIQNVLHLGIQDSHLCSIVRWVFRWDLPKIKTLRLYRVEFGRKTFKGFCAFLEANQKSIERVEMEDCKLCNECDMTMIPKGILDKVVVPKKMVGK